MDAQPLARHAALPVWFVVILEAGPWAREMRACLEKSLLARAFLPRRPVSVAAPPVQCSIGEEELDLTPFIVRGASASLIAAIVNAVGYFVVGRNGRRAAPARRGGGVLQ